MNDPKEIFDLRVVTYVNPVVAETNDIAAAQDFDDVTGYAGAAETDNTLTLAAIAARIEHPRNVVLTVTGGNLTLGYVAVYGTGVSGRKVRELFTLTGDGTYTGNVPFVTVDRASVWGCTGSLGASDHVSIGAGAKIGVPLGDDTELVDIIKEKFDNAEIAVSGTVNRVYGTYIPASTLDGSKTLELWYTTKRTLKW
jgi:hypothetical protein